MRVLMFGWEFPPHITGGLGTACFGLVKGLGKQGGDVIFVVPKAYGDEVKEGFRLVDASDIVLDLNPHFFFLLPVPFGLPGFLFSDISLIFSTVDFFFIFDIFESSNSSDSSDSFASFALVLCGRL